MSSDSIQRHIADSKRKSTVVPITRISFYLTDKNAFQEVIGLCVSWMASKSGVSLPKEAFEGKSFDVSENFGANPCKAILVEEQGSVVWAARLDHPDDTILHRTWVAEFFASRSPGAMAKFGVQLTRVSRGENPFIPMTRPKVVREILTKLSAEADGWALLERPTTLRRHDISAFEDLLYDPDRRLPVIAASENESGQSVVNLNRVAVRLAGAAHLIKIPHDVSWELTRALGKRISVFSGALRVYMPGLTEENENPFQHPLWRLTDSSTGNQLIDNLAERLLPLAFLSEATDLEFPRFATVRNYAAGLVKSQTTNVPELERLRDDLQIAERLNVEVAEERDFWESVSREEQDLKLDAQADVERLKAEIRNLEEKSRALEYKIQQRPTAEPVTPKIDPKLESYGDLEDWAEGVLGDRVEIHRAALKDCQRNGHEEALSRLQAALIIIRDYVAPAKLEKNRDKQELATIKLAEIGMDDSSCFVNREEARKANGYSVSHNGITRILYDHIKWGNGYDNSSQIRIYYFLDEERKKFVIGKMPSHLKNHLTN